MLRIFIHWKKFAFKKKISSFTIIGCLFRLNLFRYRRSHSHRKSHCNHAWIALEVRIQKFYEVHCHRHLLSVCRERSCHSARLRSMMVRWCSRLSAWKNVRLTFPFKQNKTALFRGSRMLNIICNRLDTIVLISVIILMRRDLHILIDCNNGAWNQIKSKRFFFNTFSRRKRWKKTSEKFHNRLIRLMAVSSLICSLGHCRHVKVSPEEEVVPNYIIARKNGRRQKAKEKKWHWQFVMNYEQTRKNVTRLKKFWSLKKCGCDSQTGANKFYVNFLASKNCTKRRQLHVKLLHRFFAFVVMKSKNLMSNLVEWHFNRKATTRKT